MDHFDVRRSCAPAAEPVRWRRVFLAVALGLALVMAWGVSRAEDPAGLSTLTYSSSDCWGSTGPYASPNAALGICVSNFTAHGYSGVRAGAFSDTAGGCTAAIFSNQNPSGDLFQVIASDGLACSAPRPGSDSGSTSTVYLLPPLSSQEGLRIAYAITGVLAAAWAIKMVARAVHTPRSSHADDE